MSKLLLFVIFFLFFPIHLVQGFSCVQCSSRFSEQCATDPHAFDGEECINEDEENCVIYLSDDGYTERGCRTEWETEMILSKTNSTNFLFCDYESCNRDIFPLNRIKCFECPSGRCLRRTSLKLKPCLYIDDECVVPNTDKDIIPRCLSTAKADKQCLQPGECETCSETGCNFMRTAMKENHAASPIVYATIAVIITVTIVGVVFFLIPFIASCYN